MPPAADAAAGIALHADHLPFIVRASSRSRRPASVSPMPAMTFDTDQRRALNTLI
jgi:hypothetical protein